MAYKIIASDMDETLLNDQHAICQRNIDLILKAKEKGVKFVPATGRGFMSIQHDLKTLGLYDEAQEYVISFNGGALTENKNNQLIYFEGLSFEKTKEIFEYTDLTKNDLPDEVHQMLKEKKKFHSVEEVYHFLESYSS